MENRIKSMSAMLAVAIVTGSLSATAGIQIAHAATPGVKAEAGMYDSFVVKSDGSLWSWGWNQYGQLGNGATTNQATPQKVPALSNVIDVAAGYDHTIALRNDGTVWAWGDNSTGELGDGTFVSHSSPAQVPGLTNVAAIAAGRNYSLAVRSDGTVWAFGAHGAGGILGSGATVSNSNVPMKVNGLSSIRSITSGDDFAMAQDSNGMVWAWGYNGYGQFGNGTNTSANPTPVLISSAIITNVTDMAASGYNGYWLRSDGLVFASGYGFYGGLGNNSQTDSKTPNQVSNLTQVTSIAAGGSMAVALRSNGELWMWGMGYSSTINKGPVKIMDASNIVSIDVGQDHIVAVTNDGNVLTWGRNTYGQIGNGTTGNTNQTTPTPIQDFSATFSMTAVANASTSSTIDLSFSGTGAQVSKYIVKRGGNQVYAGTATNYSDTGLSANTAYTYTIEAYGTSNVLLGTKTVSATTKPVSVTLSAAAEAVTSSTIIVNYSASDAGTVQKYVVKRGGTHLYSGSNTSFTDTGLVASTTYTYTVEAYDAANSLLAEKTVTATTQGADRQLPEMVQNLAVTSVSPHQVVLSWSDLTSADSYLVERYKGQVMEKSSSLASTTFTDSSVAPGTAYTYKVYAVADGTRGQAADVTVSTPSDQAQPNAIELQVLERGISTLKFGWSAATAYQKVVVKMGNQTVYTGAPGNQGEYTAIGLQPNSDYSVTVEIYDGQNRLIGSDTREVNTADFRVSGLKVSSLEPQKVTLSWNALAGVTGYRFDRVYAGKIEKTVTLPSTSVSYVDYSVREGIEYEYRITPLQKTIAGSVTSISTTTTERPKPPAPVLTSISVDGDGIVSALISGSAPKNFLVIEDQNGTVVRKLSVMNGYERTTKALAAGQYKVKAEAYDRELKTSSFSSAQTIQITEDMVEAPVPKNLSASTSTDGRYTVVMMETDVISSKEAKIYFYLLNEKGEQIAFGLGKQVGNKMQWLFKRDSTDLTTGMYKVRAKGYKYGNFSSPVETNVFIQGVDTFPNPNAPRLQEVEVDREGNISVRFTGTAPQHYVVVLDEEGNQLRKFTAYSDQIKSFKGLPQGIYTVFVEGYDRTYRTRSNSAQKTVEITSEMVEPPFPQDLIFETGTDRSYLVLKGSTVKVDSEEAKVYYTVYNSSGSIVTYGIGRNAGERNEWATKLLRSTLSNGTYTIEAKGYKYGQYSEPVTSTFTIE